MNCQAFTRHYEKFTPEERMRLTLSAGARDDIEEMNRLADTCPRVKLIGADPEYHKRFNSMALLTAAVILDWLEISHYVICLELLVAWQTIRSPLSAKTRKRIAYTRARHKAYSALWRGVELAITEFCREFQLTPDKLFALNRPLPSLIEAAREHLAPDVAVNRTHKRNIADRLRRIQKRNIAERLRRAWSAS
jgi:hypothetical protein